MDEIEGECIVVALDHHIGSEKLTLRYRDISVYNSKLINDEQYCRLFTDKLKTQKTPQLIYRASRDGFSSESFHKCCDDQFKVVIIVKSKEGDLFGGYTTKNIRLDGEAENVADKDLFTFRFEGNTFYTFILLPMYDNFVFYRNSSCLFAFGYCFWIRADANVNDSSGSHETENYILEECKLPNENTRYWRKVLCGRYGSLQNHRLRYKIAN